MAETEASEDKGADDIAAKANACYRKGRTDTSAWREEADLWYDMESGEQWSAEDLAALKEIERPVVTFNRILRTINAIVGTQIANRQETAFFPREVGDTAVNEILSGGAAYVRDRCDAEDEESDAFRDMCICGMGWIETRMDYDDNPEGDIVIERIDPLEMYWDTSAKKRNLADAKWVMHVKDFDLAEFEARWPDVDLSESGAGFEEPASEDVTPRTHVYPQDAYKENQALGQRDAPKKTIKVKHFQWCEYEDVYRVGKRAERMTAGDFKKIEKKLKAEGIDYIKQRASVWKRAFVAGAVTLEEGPCPYPQGPTLRCMTYARKRKDRTWYGIIKAMVDPQRFGNKFFSQILDILNKGSKGGLLIESDAAEDMREVEDKWARADAIITLRPGGMAKLMPKPVVEMPAGMDRLLAFSLDAVHEVTGVNLELLGFANREQPGVLEHQRKQAGLTIIAPLFDAERRYRKNQGHILLHFMHKYISDDRLVRITGEGGQQKYVPLALDPNTAEYDVVVDESPTSPNMKDRVYQALVQIMPALMKAGAPIPPEVLDYAPIPSKLAQKWKAMIEQGQQLPPEAQKQMEEMGKELAARGEEIAKLKDKKQETIAGLQIKDAEARADAELAREQANAKAQQTQQEMALAKWKAEQEIAILRQRTQAEIMIKAMSAASSAGGGEDGEGAARPAVDLDALRKLFEEKPKRRVVHVERDPATGFVRSAMVEDLVDAEVQGNA